MRGIGHGHASAHPGLAKQSWQGLPRCTIATFRRLAGQTFSQSAGRLPRAMLNR
ncbi:hypothetical protein HMPREF9946_00313 [Acetobacteraceae bacterium AT-5844]|nr:hypothetical protein HMPREF9946_00313 [Acetobacteraceae bacterium AT-5844]